MSKRYVITLLISIIILTSMSVVVAQDDSTEPSLNVIATTSIIADVASNVGGALTNVQSLIPVGADPHSYTPTPADVAAIADADVVLVNGLSLEETLMEIVEENATNIVVVSLGIPVIGTEEMHDEEEIHEDEHEHGSYIGIYGEEGVCEDDHDHEADHEDEHEAEEEGHHHHGACDPHVWYDVNNVIMWVENIQEAFSAADPDNSATYQDNAYGYFQQLESLKVSIDEALEVLPPEKRILVTNHGFLAYFAAAYDFTVVGTVIPSVSTLAEVSPRDLIDMVGVIEEYDVNAIFAETTASTDLAETLSAEIGDTITIASLYSGSLSDADGPASTYIDYMDYNVNTIVESLAD